MAITTGADGERPDITNIPLDFYVVDGNDEPIATFLNGVLPLKDARIRIAGSPSLEAGLDVYSDEGKVRLTGTSDDRLYWLQYTSEDCTGPAFINQPGLQRLHEISDGVYGRPTSAIRTRWKSRRKPGYLRGVYYPPSGVCEPIDQISEAILLQPYNPPAALLDPLFPLSVKALP